MTNPRRIQSFEPLPAERHTLQAANDLVDAAREVAKAVGGVLALGTA